MNLRGGGFEHSKPVLQSIHKFLNESMTAISSAVMDFFGLNKAWNGLAVIH